MNNNEISPEILWDDLLSRDRSRIRTAFAWLSIQERKAILDHLYKMASEPDWHPEQRESARIALNALDD